MPLCGESVAPFLKNALPAGKLEITERGNAAVVIDGILDLQNRASPFDPESVFSLGDFPKRRIMSRACE